MAMTRGTGQRFLKMFGPLVRAVQAHGGSARPAEVYEWIAKDQRVGKKEREALTPGGASRFEADVQFARWFLVRAGILGASERGVWTLTTKGNATTNLSVAQAKKIATDVRRKSVAETVTPELGTAPRIPSGTAAATDAVAAPDDHRRAVIEILQSLAPSGFERFCQRLLREAGFQNVEVTARSGDGGIDGTGMLRVNTLVSFRVLFQCKRYRETVGTPFVRDFRGAIQGRADKGIILTTGRFTADAREEAERDGVPPIELVDGERLVQMLEELEMGLVPKRAFDVDRSFFASFGQVLGERA